MAEPLSKVMLTLGIPIPGSNLQTPSTLGLSGWGIGTQISGHLYGCHAFPRSTWPTSDYYRANPYGCGRSVLIDGQADMTGGAQAFIKTPASYPGLVPYPGEAVEVNFAVLAVMAGTLSAGKTIRFDLQEYSSAGALLQQTTIGTSVQADVTSEWTSDLVSADVTKHASTAWFQVVAYINIGSADFVAFDFIGLGWSTYGTITPTDDYVGRSQSFREHTARIQQQAHGGFAHWVHQVGRGMKRCSLSLEWERAAQATRDDLAFLWYAQNGGIGSGDTAFPGSGNANALGGEPWPLLIRPRKPGVKQGFYGRMTAEPFGLDIDNHLGYVEEPTAWSGVVDFEEVIY